MSISLKKISYPTQFISVPKTAGFSAVEFVFMMNTITNGILEVSANIVEPEDRKKIKANVNVKTSFRIDWRKNLHLYYLVLTIIMTISILPL